MIHDVSPKTEHSPGTLVKRAAVSSPMSLAPTAPALAWASAFAARPYQPHWAPHVVGQVLVVEAARLVALADEEITGHHICSPHQKAQHGPGHGTGPAEGPRDWEHCPAGPQATGRKRKEGSREPWELVCPVVEPACTIRALSTLHGNGVPLQQASEIPEAWLLESPELRCGGGP